MKTINKATENTEQKVIRKVSKTLEAARKLKGSIIVNDLTLFIH